MLGSPRRKRKLRGFEREQALIRPTAPEETGGGDSTQKPLHKSDDVSTVSLSWRRTDTGHVLRTFPREGRDGKK